MPENSCHTFETVAITCHFHWKIKDLPRLSDPLTKGQVYTFSQNKVAGP